MRPINHQPIFRELKDTKPRDEGFEIEKNHNWKFKNKGVGTQLYPIEQNPFAERKIIFTREREREKKKLLQLKEKQRNSIPNM